MASEIESAHRARVTRCRQIAAAKRSELAEMRPGDRVLYVGEILGRLGFNPRALQSTLLELAGETFA